MVNAKVGFMCCLLYAIHPHFVDLSTNVLREGTCWFFAFSALTEETLENLKPDLDVLVETRTITGLADDTFEQATRVRLRKRKPRTPPPPPQSD